MIKYIAKECYSEKENRSIVGHSLQVDVMSVDVEESPNQLDKAD
jgi:hypothetical protein